MPLAGCSPPISQKDAEKELVAFMLDLIIQKENKETAEFVQSSGEPWLNPPSYANLIVYAPPNEDIDKDPWEQLNVDDPIMVWWYFDNQLVEANKKQTAIRKWKENYLFKPGANSGSKSWPTDYEFGILSISRNHKKAMLYFSWSYCPECAVGFIYTLRRNNSGEWEIKDSEVLWVS